MFMFYDKNSNDSIWLFETVSFGQIDIDPNFCLTNTYVVFVNQIHS